MTDDSLEYTPHPKSRWSVTTLIVLLALGAAVLGSRWIMSQKPQAKKGAPKAHRVWVDLASVELKNHRLNVSGMGEIRAHRQVTLQPELTGRVMQVEPDIEAGVEVRQGQLLCTLDQRDLLISIEREKSNVAQAELALLEEQGRAALAKEEWQRLGASSASSLQRQLSTREPHLKRAEAALKAAKASLHQAQIQLERCSIRAPFTGILVTWSAQKGSQVTPQTPLGTLLDHKRFDLELQLRKDQLDLLPRRKNIPVSLEGQGVVLQGSLKSILPMHHGKGRLVTAIVSIENPLDGEGSPLFVGGFIKAHMQSLPFANSFILPRSALSDQEGLWVCNSDNTLNHKKVEFYPTGQNDILVTSGLNNGDRVVTSGLSVAVEGMVVHPKP